MEHSLKTSSSAIIYEARTLDLNDLPRIDAHLHTSWTDGEPTVLEVYERASMIGLSAILYSEHSRKTSADWFSDFAAEVRSLPDNPCKAFVGTEVKIETLDGEIDLAPEINDLCDLIMASVHRFPDGNGEAIPFERVRPEEAVDREFSLSWTALENPKIDILGHMFGMSYRRFNTAPPHEKMRSLIERAARMGVAVEVNSYYHPNPRQMIEWCKEFDALITFGSNAHDLGNVGAITRLLEKSNAN